MEKGWAEIPLAGCKQVKARKLESRISSIPQYLARRLLYLASYVDACKML